MDPAVATALAYLIAIVLVLAYWPLLTRLESLHRRVSELEVDVAWLCGEDPPVEVSPPRRRLLHRLIHRGDHRRAPDTSPPTSPGSTQP